MDTYDFSELSSVLQEEGGYQDQIAHQSANDFLAQMDSVVPMKLSDAAQARKLSTEALLLELIETEIELFVISSGWCLEVDKLVELNSEFVTRAEYEEILYKTTSEESSVRIPTSAHRKKHTGYIRLTRDHLLALACNESINIDRYWTNEGFTEYIDLKPSRVISHSDICLDQNQLKQLSETRSGKAVNTSKDPRDDKIQNLLRVIAGLSYALANKDKKCLSSTNTINKSELAIQLLKAIKDEGVSEKTVHTILLDATRSYPPAAEHSNK